MFCSNCGYEIANEARFCAQCGTEIEPLAPSAPSTPAAPQEAAMPSAPRTPTSPLRTTFRVAMGVLLSGGLLLGFVTMKYPDWLEGSLTATLGGPGSFAVECRRWAEGCGVDAGKECMTVAGGKLGEGENDVFCPDARAALYHCRRKQNDCAPNENISPACRKEVFEMLLCMNCLMTGDCP